MPTAFPPAETAAPRVVLPSSPRTIETSSYVIEIVSDPGEGAQKCGQVFATVSAKMGNGVWTVEIIPAEIQPPARDSVGASGNRVRIGSGPVTNWGDAANLIVAFNEQVLLGRERLGALADDAVILLENRWAKHDDPAIRAEYAAALDELGTRRYRVIEVPMEDECLQVVDDAAKGKNMFVLGLLAFIFDRDLAKLREQIAFAFRKKSAEVYQNNVALLERGYDWATRNVDFRVIVPPATSESDLVVMNGNQAAALGAIAAGMELAAMYPITPATSVSHYLGEIFEDFGGILHQAEDEIAAIGVALGASYAGKVAFTITSGPGLALKTEFIGLAVMTETPLVVLDVQRGGPSTGCPPRSNNPICWRCCLASPAMLPRSCLHHRRSRNASTA
jgi:2-oxoglutarate ferredoxin oxidoreductase subunit alpha